MTAIGNVVTKRMPTCACLNCGLEVSGATGWEGRGPHPGDASVCLRCGHFMVFADDMTLRAPTDAEILEWAGDPALLLGQNIAERMRRIDWRQLPVPDRMKHLPRDPRGYPIFFMAYRDANDRAHFSVNDSGVRARVIARDLCSICGKPLLRGRWFVGGQRSAFDPHGAYIDPPMHRECAHYALRVCPYLASPTYASLIHGNTMPSDDRALLIDQTEIESPSTAHEVRPPLFVAVHARGQRFHPTPAGGLIFPTRPYIVVEYWQHGWKLAQDEGERLCRMTGVEPDEYRNQRERQSQGG
jgi:hypothetical protein